MNKTINYTIYFLLAASIIMRLPTILSNFSREGKKVGLGYVHEINSNSTYDSLKGLNATLFPIANQKSIVIFWASWCSPCKIELSRINSAIEKKEIDAKNIFAISLDENFDALKMALKEREYKFKVFYDKSGIFSKAFQALGTPTVLFINKDMTIDWITTGLSPKLIYNIERFQKN